MAIKTHFWKTSNGKKIPLLLMGDNHIKNSYRRCLEVLSGIRTVDPFYQLSNEEGLSNEEAQKWKEIFEEEAKRRKITLPKIDHQLGYKSYNTRIDKKRQALERNMKFDKKFKK